MLVESRIEQSTSEEGRLTPPFPTIQINKSEAKRPSLLALCSVTVIKLASHRVYELFPFFL